MRGFNIFTILSLFVVFGLQLNDASAQTGVSINSTGTAPDGDAVLDITSADKGVLLPRVANHTTLTPDNNADYGLVVFNTTSKTYWYWDGTAWQEIPNMGSIGTTLDDAYDGGGSGAGRTITADAGNVEIQGAGHLTVAANVGVGTTTPASKLDIVGEVRVSNGDGDKIHLTPVTNGSRISHSSGWSIDYKAGPGTGAQTGVQRFFTTNGAYVERMRIQPDGNVGIGSTAPDRKVKVSGSGWTALEIENTDNQDAALELTSQGVSNYVFTDNTGFLGVESAAGQDIVLRTDGGTERMRIQNTSGDVRVINLADAASAVVLSDPQGDLTKTSLTGSATDVFLGTGAFGPASALEDDDWYTAGSTSAPTAITDNIYTQGNVAIGANITASAPLQVQASGAGNPANNSILANNPNNSGGNDAIVAARVAGTAAGDPFFSMDVSGEAGWSMGLDNSHDNRLKIAPSWNNLSFNTSMTIKTDGNVGIATDDPDQKLQVNGVMRSEGSYVVDVDGANGSGPRIAWGSTANPYAFMNIGSYTGINNLETTTRDFRIGASGEFNALYVEAATGEIGIGNNTPGYDLDVTGNTRTTGDFFGDVHVDDTRNVNSPPSTYDNEVAFDFKNRTTVGAPGSGTYSGMMTIAPWSDNSGNNHHQINFNQGGLYWRQGQPDAGSWGSWVQIMTANNSILGSGTTNYLARWTNSTTLGIGTTYDNGTNVGLGTTTPGQKLEVNGNISLPSSTGNKQIYTWSPTDANWRIGMSASPGFTRGLATSHVEYATFASGAGQGFAVGDAVSGLSAFEVTGSGSGYNAYFRGNVGIGTATPDANLNIGNPAGATLYLTREDGTTTTNEVLGSLLFGSTDQTVVSTVDAAAGIRGYASQNQGNSNKGGYLTFFTKNNVAFNAAATERMRIHANGTVRIASLDQNANRIVMADANGDLYASSSLVGTGLGDNLGNHTATTNLAMAGNEIDNVRYVDITAGNGQGIRFWQSNSYAINMGNASEFRYGAVQDYSIKMNMNNDSDRGWTWGIDGSTTNAGALSTEGHMTLRGTLFLDCVECGSTSSAYPNTGSSWGDMAIQGRVLSTNSNLHLSPPNGFNVVINDTYRAGGGSSGGSDAGLIVEGSAAIGQTTLNGSYKLIVNGKFKSTGINETSDIRLKKDITSIDGALADVLKMNGVTYNWRKDEFPEKNFSDKLEYGLIAQELEKIIPELVDTDEEGYKSIQYTHLVPVLIEALKEQQSIIESQNKDIIDLKLKADASASQIEAILERLDGYSNK